MYLSSSASLIRMFHQEHNPPHFHAEYSGQTGVFDFDGNMLDGNMKSKRAKKLIREWARLRNTELVQNWERAMKKEEIGKIDPLE